MPRLGRCCLRAVRSSVQAGSSSSSLRSSPIEMPSPSFSADHFRGTAFSSCFHHSTDWHFLLLISEWERMWPITRTDGWNVTAKRNTGLPSSFLRRQLVNDDPSPPSAFRTLSSSEFSLKCSPTLLFLLLFFFLFRASLFPTVVWGNNDLFSSL